jgi:transposase InsO family protein
MPLWRLFPCKVEIVLTDNGIQFADLPKNRSGLTAMFRGHPLQSGLREPWHRTVADQAQPCLDRWAGRTHEPTIKEATVQRYHYDRHEQLETHLADFVAAYNFGRRLEALKGLTPYEFICKRWALEPEKLRLNPLHQMLGLNNACRPPSPARSLIRLA